MRQKNKAHQFNINQSGYMLMAVLVFMSIFFLVTGSLLSYSWSCHRASYRKFANNQAFHIAEAGIQYMRWHLAHAPSDYTNDLGIHDYRDPQGGIIGQYNLSITAPEAGSSIVILRSTGWTKQYPSIQRTLEVRYGKPTLADYGFLSNADAWFGENEQIKGPVHSNGGIRMDGVCDSRMTSAKATYLCTPIHGCSNQEKPGIWGSGENPALWDFPVLPTDFASITLDLQTIKDQAMDKGIFLNNSGGFGFHLVFHNDGTFSVYKVTALKPAVNGYDGTKWVLESNDIHSETLVAGFSHHAWPTNNIIFSQEKLWVQGEVTGRVTVVAASLPVGEHPAVDIIIPNNITLPTKDGSTTIGLIAQEDILVPLYSPSTLEIQAILLAQTGHVFRYYYQKTNKEPYKTYAIRDTLEIYGGIITNTVWTWTWVSGNPPVVVSGYRNTDTKYNPYLLYSPPPYWPTTKEFQFISWEEINN